MAVNCNTRPSILSEDDTYPTDNMTSIRYSGGGSRLQVVLFPPSQKFVGRKWRSRMVKRNSVLTLNSARRIEDIRGTGGTAPCILNPGTGRR